LNLSLRDKISALYLCADILDYPDTNYLKNVKKFENLIDIKFDFQKVNFDDICAEHIRVFSINSTKLKCVPYASWWLDGKMSGKNLSNIIDFYTKCGYSFDADLIKKPADNISSMISFVALLAEDKKFKEIKEFAKFLAWTTDFANSLDMATDIEIYKYAINLASKIIRNLKEEV